MYFRFHKRLMLIPGLRLNLAKTGPSIGLGVNGGMINVGPASIRTTVGIPGSGFSLINRKSWGAMSGDKRQTQRDGDIAASIDAALDGMSHRKKREFFIKMVAEAPLADLKAHREAVDAQIAKRSAEIEEIDRIDIADMRQIYADAIATKEAEARRAALIPLALVAAGGLGMWAGIAGGNGWMIAASVCALLAASFTKAGQLFWFRVNVLLLAALGLLVAAAFVGFVTVMILSMSGKL
jgi:hypothetical protein